MSDAPTLVTFEIGFRPIGIAEDGLPMFEEVIKIRKSKPPYLEVLDVATEDDFIEFADPYTKFQREQHGLKLTGKTGYPLVMWPAVNPAELQMCIAREIDTVEDLAKLALRSGGNSNVPPQILELAKRAKKMVELQAKTGKHEVTITNLEEQLVALREQNNELKTTIEGLRIEVDRMRVRGAA